MFKLFVSLNVRLWWRSLRGIEIGAILFYSIFLLLILGQFIGIAVTLLFAPELEIVQEAYPWFTADVQLMFNLIFINMFWFTQLFFTKISRLRINDNRKLLALGMPVRKLVNYLNLAGFFHPVNLLFNAIWIFYLGLLTDSVLQFSAVVLLIIANYGVINSFKWRFKLFTDENLKWVNGVLGIFVIMLILFSSSMDFRTYFEQPELVALNVNQWLIFTPGSFFYWMSHDVTNNLAVWASIAVFGGLIILLKKDLNEHTKHALLMPVASSSSSSKDSNQISLFISWLGHQGGKYFYSVWNHPYSKTQFLLTYVLVIPYIIIMNDGTPVGSYMVAVFLALMPVLFLMVMLTNMFGFEHRELLLSLQAPVHYSKIIQERFLTALKISQVAMLTVLIAIPFFFDTIITMFQILCGVIFITVVFLHYVLNSCIDNYKKIENVSLMSVSNPVVPASVTFTSMFIVLVLGVFTFIILDQNQWVHIVLLICANTVMIIWFIKKFKTISQPFKSKVIPQLWNEL
jgi:hypothetical protein